ncbi:efflux RND transporter periplasmic adaptor subunit [Pararhizobium mangrovi]|uniref:Efflux RND transporter periplasmic adaptor subunit n=1 Tax=Pararhizobium mangrovi TaxID=2590452 RepID=A0A506UCS2_9HYPH|nr:efflux RND transporter periplasmic adaptor subunit [Pararhizobium mangrovi]TPW29547.1 efflux RND transporter periplasmic adaptor subunit [Pararhizobium mangrovi]
MALWKQAFLCLVLLVGAFVAWVRFDPGATQRLAGWGIQSSVIAAIAPDDREKAKAPTAAQRSAGVDRAALVATSPVESATLNSSFKAIGSGIPLHTATVTPADAGTLTAIRVEAGVDVKEGDAIATLDSQPQRIAADKAKLALEDAQKKLDRLKQLRQSSTVSSVQISDQQNVVASNKLALEQAQYDLDKRTIAAPIAGVVGIIPVNTGDYVTAQTKIATIDDRSKILVDFQVPERFSGQLKKGMPLSATSSAFPGKKFEGKVQAIDNRVDAESRTFQVRAALPNDEDRLRAGMSFLVTMKFPGDVYPAVDPLAVQWDSSGAYVWRVADGQAERVDVGVVQRNPESILVSGKLARGDTVVTQGVQVLRPGATVRVADSNGDEDDSAAAKNTRHDAARRKEAGSAAL